MARKAFRKKKNQHLLLDALMLPILYPAAWLLKKVRRVGIHRLPLCRRALRRIGVFPIRDHFYEPLFNHERLQRPLSAERSLPGIDFNLDAQLALLQELGTAGQLHEVSGTPSIAIDADTFGPGDAEFWYGLIRARKPARIFEIGSGHSTRVAIRAIQRNQLENPSYSCKHMCIEPFKSDWLEQTGVTVLRSKVEDLGPDMFRELRRNDILFIDSSHMIRPQGDVLFEYLQLLPRLNVGVIVHVHDIFTPRDYPACWLKDRVRFWNEQYLLEAFLTSNGDWKVLAALNHLHHSHQARLAAACPSLTPASQPGSFYLQRVR